MRATRLSKLQLKAMRADANTLASTPLSVEGVSGQTAQLVSFVNGNASGGLAIGQKTIADGSATSLFDVSCASGTRCGGLIIATVEASDGTDHQSMTSLVTFAAVNKAGTLTLTITSDTANDAKAVSSGTLTLAWTFVTGTGKGTVKLQPTGSLTETTFTVTFIVLPAVGTITLV